MNERFEQAQHFYRQRDYRRVIDILTPVSGGPHPQAKELLLLANAYEAMEMHIESLQAMQQALAAEPENADAWNNLGAVCMRIRRMSEAREAFERAYRLDPGRADFLVNLGSLSLKQSDPDKAKEYLELALQLDASHAAAHANLAITLAMFGRLEEAEESLRIAVLYGFNDSAPILERIDRMKSIRQSIIDNEESKTEANPSGETPDLEEARRILAQKERLLFELVRKEHDAFFHASPDGSDIAADPTLEGEIAALRMEVREMRRAFELPEVTENDMFMGENYMLTPDELEEYSGDADSAG